MNPDPPATMELRPDPPEWQATMELRWHLHVEHQRWDGREYVDVGRHVLEQKWRNVTTGAEEWREVPTHRTAPPNLMSYS